jgi:DNA (cytosine-5)-methyltransferase 1
VRYGSVCSGIEAASVAWEPLGWKASFLSEIDKFPRAVLAAHYPKVPLHGDFTTIQAGEYDPIDLLVGGTPCQSFSVAGLRGGLADGRGNLALEYLKLAQRLRPKWLVWENVPGVLSSAGGRDFGSILGGLVELGYGFAYRVLDAQYFGVPQRRRRVFVVGYLGDWRRAAAVLFERHSLQGHSPPRREARQGSSTYAATGIGEFGEGLGTLRAQGGDCGGGSEHLIAGALKASLSSTQCPNEDATLIVSADDVSLCLNAGKMARMDPDTETFISVVRNGNAKQWPADVAGTLDAHYGDKQGLEDQHVFGQNASRFVHGVYCRASGQANADTLLDQAPTLNCNGDLAPIIAHALRADGFDASEDGSGRGTPLVPVAFSSKDHGADAGYLSPTLRAMGHSGSHANAGGQVAIAYALQERAGCENPNAGPDGAGYREGASYTLEARQTPQAVAYNITPSQSNKDYNARASERSQAITGNGNRPSARGGDVIAFDTTQMTSKANRSNPQAGDPSHPLAAGAHAPAIAFNARQDPTHGPVADPLGTKDTGHGFLRGSAVRRLTPRECERLQGFPDDYTLISHRGKPSADGPRYKALGNSMAVPVMAWIGQRIQMVEEQAA